jgi:hypothetical protein
MTKRAAHYAPRIAKDICREIAMGATLKKALDKVGYLAPSMTTFWRWLDEHADFREMYERARQLQADSDADRMRELAEEVIERPNAATAIRVATDILKWQAEVRNKTKYGNKTEDPRAAKPLNPADLRKEIKRLETELGVAESQGVKMPISLVKPRNVA